MRDYCDCGVCADICICGGLMSAGLATNMHDARRVAAPWLGFKNGAEMRAALSSCLVAPEAANALVKVFRSPHSAALLQVYLIQRGLK